MIFDIDMIRSVYAQMAEKVDQAKKTTAKPLSLSEKNIICPPSGRPAFSGV